MLRRRITERIVRFASRTVDADRALDLMAAVQEMRTSLEELQTAGWHLMALPTRYDVRKVQRCALALRRRVRELDLAVARLEAAVED